MELMDNNKIKEMLPDYIQGQLSKEDSVAVKEQLKKSGSLRREYEELRSYYNAINTLKPVKAPGNFLDNIHARIAIQPPLVKFVKTVFHPLHIKVPLELAGVALTTVLVILIFNPFKPKTIPPVVFDETGIQTEKPLVESKIVEEKAEEVVAELQDKKVEKEPQPVKQTPEVAKPEDVIKAKKTIPTTKQPVKKQEEVHYALKKDISPTTPSEATQGAASAPAESQTRDELKAELHEKIASLESTKHGLSKPAPIMELAEEEVYADEIIERSDSIVLSKRQIKPEPVDIGLLALSIAKKDEPKREFLELKSKKTESRKKKRLRSSEKTGAVTPTKAAPEAAEAVQPESENDIIFAQVQSTIKANKGEFTLLQDKPQKLDKRYYVIEISSENFSALRKALEKQGVVIEENFSFDEEESELIKFNLIVRIE